MSKVKIGDVCNILNGFAFKSERYVDEGIRVVRITNVQKGYIEDEKPQFYPAAEMENIKDYILQENDLLLSLTGNVGRVAMLDKSFLPAALNQRVACLRIKDSDIILKYLYYALLSNRFENDCISSAKGIAQKNMSTEWLKKYEINIFDKEKQTEIVNIFDNLTSIISARKQQLQKLDELVKARFVEMFDMQKCKRKTLGECTDFVDYRGHTPELSDTGTVRMVNAKSVGKGFFKYVEEYVTEETYDSWMHRGFGYPGDILFVTEGHTFGNTCLIPNDLQKFALGQRVITIKGHQELLNAFLCSYMQTDMFWKDINVYRTGGTAQGIRSKDLVKVHVPIPPLEQQRQFATFVEQIDKSKVAVQKALDEAQTLFDSLMQEYFG